MTTAARTVRTAAVAVAVAVAASAGIGSGAAAGIESAGAAPQIEGAAPQIEGAAPQIEGAGASTGSEGAGASVPARGPGAAVAPVRLVPTGPGTLEVSGRGSFFGELHLRSASDGLVLINRLSLETYLLGLEEVPPSWPEEALEAQAVAARTYALWTLARPRAGAAALYGFDICATVQCQVFSGADVVASALGRRWAAAVAATKGRALLYGGEPILARYHSTSGGRTLDNQDAFPGDPSYPYLVSVTSPTETASPLWRWRVRFRLRRLEHILEHAGMWPSSRRLASVETEARPRPPHNPAVILRGRAATTVVPAQEFRAAVRSAAPSLYPGSYPSPAGTPSGRLPETLPSSRVTISTRRRTVIVVGRGWGHGSGMSQWGAHGLAELGRDHSEILAHYYTGARLASVADPGSIDVGVAWGLGGVDVYGGFEIVDGRGRTLVRDALGSWTFRPAGPGAVAIEPPPGHGLPLEIGIVDAPAEIEPGSTARIVVALSRPARVRVGRDRARILDAGRAVLQWRAPGAAGRHRVAVRAAAGGRRKRDEVSVRVVERIEPAAGSQAPGRPPGGSAGVPAAIAVGAIAAAAAALAVCLGRIRSWTPRR